MCCWYIAFPACPKKNQFLLPTSRFQPLVVLNPFDHAWSKWFSWNLESRKCLEILTIQGTLHAINNGTDTWCWGRAKSFHIVVSPFDIESIITMAKFKFTDLQIPEKKLILWEINCLPKGPLSWRHLPACSIMPLFGQKPLISLHDQNMAVPVVYRAIQHLVFSCFFNGCFMFPGTEQSSISLTFRRICATQRLVDLEVGR